MGKEVGLWIDHQKTVIVTIAGESEEIRKINSNIEEYVQSVDGTRSKPSSSTKRASGADEKDKSFGKYLNGYYDAVISLIRDADSILLFGPGEAKVDLGKRIESKELSGEIVGIETAGKMTDRQIAAKVRQCYSGWD